jgi:enediyne biosynthesis protein E7
MKSLNETRHYDVPHARPKANRPKDFPSLIGPIQSSLPTVTHIISLVSPADVSSSSATTSPAAPRFSIVILTFNREPLLPRALESIFSQSGDDSEILVIDDGSTDGTPALLATYADRIRVVRQEHAGSMAGCRAAFHAARSNWFIYVDSDDELRPGAMAALRSAAAAHPDASLVLPRFCSINPSGRRVESAHIPLDPDPLINFRAFATGKLHAVIAGGLISRDLLSLFDNAAYHNIHGVDLAVLGAGLMRKTVQIGDITLNVWAHDGRLRNDIHSIHQSGLRLVDMLFRQDALPPAARKYRNTFLAFLQLERARAYYRARWYSQSWRAFAGAVAASPRALLNFRNLRRAAFSFLFDITRRPEGPIRTPPGSRILGHGKPLWNDSIRFLKTCSDHFGPVTRLRVRPRTFVLCEPDDGSHVLITNVKNYHKTGILRLDPILAGGFIGLNPPEHAERRRALPVNFGRQATQSFLTTAADVIDRHIAAWASKPQAEIGLLSQDLFIELAGRLILGCDDRARLRELTSLLAAAHQLSRRELRAHYRWPGITAPAWIPLRRRRRAALAQRKIHDWFDRLIADHPTPDGTDMLSTMRRTLPAEEARHATTVRAMALMTYLGAMEPASITLAWALELLADHPDVQDRVATEARAAFSSDLPTPDQIALLTYTAQVVSETTRLYPNEWLLTRRAVAEDRLPSGARIRAGEEVMISPYLFGHDARFFPDPERFDPDRFSPDRSPTWPASAFIPFGSGPRSCIGEQIAHRLLALALGLLTRRYRFEPIPDGRGKLESPNLFTSQSADSRLILRIAPHKNDTESIATPPV